MYLTITGEHTMTQENTTPGRAYRAPRMLLQEVLEDLAIHDQSVAAMADDMKRHAGSQAQWAFYVRSVRTDLGQAENELDLFVAQKTAAYAVTAKSATAVQNYAKNDVQTMPEYQSLKRRVMELKNTLQFCSDIMNIFNRRGEMLIALSRLDSNIIIRGEGGPADYNIQMRAQLMRYNKLDDMLKQPWGQSQI